MNVRAVLYPIGLIVLAFAGSDIFKAEILTEFEISPDQAYPNKYNLINVTNIGYVQADNVLVLITVDKNITNVSDICAEGKIVEWDNKTLIAEFSRMSPHMPCGFELTVSGKTSLNYIITADDRLSPWNGSSYVLFVYSLIGILVLIFVVEIILLWFGLKEQIYSIAYWFDSFFHKSKIESEGLTDTIGFVKRKYDIRIDETDAAILEQVYYGNKMFQLKEKTDLSKWQINSRINRMRKCELLAENAMDVEKILMIYFRRRDEGCMEEDPSKEKRPET